MIESEHLIFKPITEEDTDMVLKWRNSEAVKNNFLYRKDITREEHLNWLDSKVKTGSVIQFIIVEKQNERPVGSVYFRDVDHVSKKAEYGIFIGEPDARGHGYGSETAVRMVRYFFDEMKFHKLSLRVLERNLAAVKSYENAGFKVEGRMVDELFVDGTYETVIFMAVFENDRRDEGQ